MTEVPNQAYKDAGQGRLTMEELGELESMAEFLNGGKIASVMDTLRSAASSPAGQRVGEGLALSAGLAGAGLLARAVVSGAQAAQNQLTYRRDLGRLLAIRPEIKDQYNDRDIHLAFQSMRTLSPTLAAEPLTGSTLLTQILRNRDAHNPSAPPRMDPGVARELLGAQRRGDDSLARMMEGAFHTGVKSVYDQHRRDLETQHGEARDSIRDAKKEQMDLAREQRMADARFQEAQRRMHEQLDRDARMRQQKLEDMDTMRTQRLEDEARKARRERGGRIQDLMGQVRNARGMHASGGATGMTTDYLSREEEY